MNNTNISGQTGPINSSTLPPAQRLVSVSKNIKIIEKDNKIQAVLVAKALNIENGVITNAKNKELKNLNKVAILSGTKEKQETLSVTQEVLNALDEMKKQIQDSKDSRIFQVNVMIETEDGEQIHENVQLEVHNNTSADELNQFVFNMLQNFVATKEFKFNVTKSDIEKSALDEHKDTDKSKEASSHSVSHRQILQNEVKQWLAIVKLETEKFRSEHQDNIRQERAADMIDLMDDEKRAAQKKSKKAKKEKAERIDAEDFRTEQKHKRNLKADKVEDSKDKAKDFEDTYKKKIKNR